MNAWRDAAKDLGIRVDIPFSLVSVSGETELYEGRAIDFGSPNGVVFGIFDDDTTSGSAERLRVTTGQVWPLATGPTIVNCSEVRLTIVSGSGQRDRKPHGIQEGIGASGALISHCPVRQIFRPNRVQSTGKVGDITGLSLEAEGYTRTNRRTLLRLGFDRKFSFNEFQPFQHTCDTDAMASACDPGIEPNA